MVIRIAKGISQEISRNINSSQFDCKCDFPECDSTLYDTDLVSYLDHLDDLFGMITITSGYRCKKHNNAVGGEPGSFHMKGQAADIKTELATTKELYHAIEGLLGKSGGLGLYSTFCHLDVREGCARWGI